MSTDEQTDARRTLGYATALRSRIRPRFDDTPVGAIDRTAVKKFVAEMAARPLAPKTIANTALVLRLVLQEPSRAGRSRTTRPPTCGSRWPAGRSLASSRPTRSTRSPSRRDRRMAS